MFSITIYFYFVVRFSRNPATHLIETTIERDKMGGSVSLPLSLIVLYGGFPQKFVSDLESARLAELWQGRIACKRQGRLFKISNNLHGASNSAHACIDGAGIRAHPSNTQCIGQNRKESRKILTCWLQKYRLPTRFFLAFLVRYKTFQAIHNVGLFPPGRYKIRNVGQFPPRRCISDVRLFPPRSAT